MTPEQMTALAGEVRAADAALKAVTDSKFDAPEWDAYHRIRERWENRPHGRDAAPGDLWGRQLPGEWPSHGGDIKCRRCNGIAGLEGHPHGCPVTPHDFGELRRPMHRCYCGQTLVLAAVIFSGCCAGTPPVAVPGGCRWCGSSLCRVGDPGDQPEKQYDVPERYPGMGTAWLHARCYDDHLLGRGNDEWVAKRRRARAVPLGVIEAI